MAQTKDHEAVFRYKVTTAYPNIEVTGAYAKAKVEITYMDCQHTALVIPSNLLTRGSICRTCKPIGVTKRTFAASVAAKYPNIQVTSEYLGAKQNVEIKYLDCEHTQELSATNLLNRGRTCAPFKWTDEALLVRRVQGGSTQEEIAKELDRTAIAIAHKARLLIPQKSTRDLAVDKLAAKYPNIEMIGQYTTCKNRVDIRYRDCGHVNSVRLDDLLNRGSNSICRECTPVISHNRPTQKEFVGKVNTLYPDIEILEKYVTQMDRINIRFTSCGHETTVLPKTLLRDGANSICRVCTPVKNHNKDTKESFSNKLSLLYPNIEVVGDYVASQINVEIRYKDCGHTHNILPSNLLHQGTSSICRVCHPIKQSKGELELRNWIEQHVEIITNDRTIIAPLELDIVIPSLKLAYEYNGEYFHSDLHKTKDYHLNKTIRAAKAGYQLIHLWQHEWQHKKDLILSRISSRLGLNEKIGARKCTVKQLEMPKDFLAANHLQGIGTSSKYNYGLYYNDELVSVMTFSKPRFNHNYDWELIRFCTKAGLTIVGAASKLLKQFRLDHSGIIISYSDRRFGDGGVYRNLGFELSHSSSPSYFYFNGSSDLLTRYKCQKAKLKKLFPDTFDDELTEKENMTKAGYFRCYDCGTDCFSLL